MARNETKEMRILIMTIIPVVTWLRVVTPLSNKEKPRNKIPIPITKVIIYIT